MGIVAIGLSHHSCPVEMRERFAFKEESLPVALQELRETAGLSEAVILSTCNRVEIYGATDENPANAIARVLDFLKRFHEFEGDLEEVFYRLEAPTSVEHLFKVASGMDSMVLGETEILGQMKKAYDLALSHKHTGGRLNKAFQKAFNVAKHIRTETRIQRGSVSVGSVAVELAEKIFDSLKGKKAMVIGAGDTSEKTARFLLGRGASDIVVTNRSIEKAEALAAELGGSAIPFSDWASRIAEIDIIISSTSAPHYVLDRARLEKMMPLRGRRPILLIDIAVPRDLDPELNYLDDVFLYNIDDLQAIAADYMKEREKEIARCSEIISTRAAELIESLRPRMGSLKAGPPSKDAELRLDPQG